jgi:hypothetical protein
MPKKVEFRESNLSESTQKWVQKVMKLYDFDTGELEILRKAAELRDMADNAKLQIETDGAFYSNRFGEPRQHPGLRVYQQSVDLMARLLKQLKINSEDVENG